MRVDLLTPRFWPEVRRGTERFTADLGLGLRERGHAARVVTSHRGPRGEGTQVQLPVVRVRRGPETWLQRLHVDEPVTHLMPVYRELARGAADVVHAMAVPDALAGLAWRRRSGTPVVLSFMGIPRLGGLAAGHPRRRLMRATMAGVDAVVVLSGAAQAALRDELGIDAHLIAPGVDLKRFVVGAERAAVPTIVCAADAAVPRKHVPALLDAFAIIRRTHPEARLVLDRPRDPTLARRLRQDGVDLRGLDEAAALAHANGEAWTAVLPSVGEGFGLVLLEALATGTPVVGVADAGMADIVDSDRVGRLVDSPEPRLLAAALLETLALAQDPAVRAVCRSRAEVFDAERCVGRYLELYERVIAGADTRRPRAAKHVRPARSPQP